MKDFSIIDLLIRKITSVAYRILLILYATFLCVIFENHFEWWVYVIIATVYFLFFLILSNKEGKLSLLRLFNDYILIILFLIGKPMDNILTYSFILIPIINSPNHTGNKRTMLLYFIAAFSFLFLAKNLYNWEFYIPFITFLILGTTEYKRTQLRNFNDEIVFAIESFFQNELVKNKSHRIYHQIIKILNGSKFKRIFTINRIVCFRFFLKNEKLEIVNSSHFIWEFSLNNPMKLLEDNKNRYNCFSNLEFILDGQVCNQNRVIVTFLENDPNPYVFLLDINPKPMFGFDFFYYQLLSSTFFKIARKFDLENELWRKRHSELLDITEKREFIAIAENSVHFIKNKLSSIVNYIDCVENLALLDLAENQKHELEKIKDLDFQRMKTVTEEIKHKIKLILDKSKNPYRFGEMNTHKISNLYSILHKAIQESIVSNRVIYDFDELSKGNPEKSIKYNGTGMEIVFALWVSNLQEHTHGEIKVKISETDETYVLEIINCISEKEIDHLAEICVDFNQIDNVQLLRRKTLGLEQIKDYLHQMETHSELTLDTNNNSLSLKITLKKSYEENTDF